MCVIKVYLSNLVDYMWWKKDHGIVLKKYDATKFATRKEADLFCKNNVFLSIRKTKICEVENG